MEYRRVFIVRKDLHMSAGKMSAQLAHCAEIYWLNMLKPGFVSRNELGTIKYYEASIPTGIADGYINGRITKTVCEAKNLHQLLRAKEFAEAQGLVEGKDFGFVNDACNTELTPENENGTTTTAFWTAPLPDDVAWAISKKFQLYKD